MGIRNCKLTICTALKHDSAVIDKRDQILKIQIAAVTFALRDI